MRILVFALTLILFALPGTPVAAGEGKLVHVLRFYDYKLGSVQDWLQGKGFKFEQDAQRRDHIDLDVGQTGLTMEAKRRSFGVMPNESVNVPDFSYIEIDWGVNKFPKGASYEQGIRNEALIVFVFMGDERQPSGSMFIPDSPYFIGLFLCDGTDKLKFPYVGAYFKKGGRYVCTNRPTGGKLITSRFNLKEAYRKYFDKENDDDPAVSGIALGLDTKKAKDKGRTSAFIREIRFFR